MKRMRGRNHRGGTGGGGPVRHQSGHVPLNRNHVFDSSGPDLRVRGTSQQLFEKYLQLGRDATSSGDRVMAESYFQHAEHYFRILNAMNLAAQQSGQGGGGQGNGHANGGNPRRQGNDSLQDSATDMDEQAEVVSAPGMGEQPVAEPRDIPIAASAPEA